MRECLNSILNQTIKDIEIICINDGSTDGSLSILEEYTGKDQRVIVVTQKNQGQGSARNEGLEMARGQYILFVDPDDFLIQSNALEKLFDLFQNNVCDIVQFDWTEYNESNKSCKIRYLSDRLKKLGYSNLKKRGYYSWKNIQKTCLQTAQVWDKCYSRKFIVAHSIKFSLIRNGEDHLFSNMALLLSDRVYYLDENIYCYRIRKGSVTNSSKSKQISAFDGIAALKTFLEKYNFLPKLETAFKKYKIDALVLDYRSCSEHLKKDFERRCQNYLSRDEYEIFLKKIQNKNTLFQQIFSVRKRSFDGNVRKIITVLGVKFYL